MVYWKSVSDFLEMGGYGLYVWTSFIITALCMVWELLALWRRRVAALAESRGITRSLG
ncbi:MAG: heme exporter protein CcmD [Nitrospira sp.]|nr:heme exporter protein CcmD [Nitrospira sp.]MCP9464093.1 heme exporter protein CcmD [Nitrospira sp.]